MNFKHLWTPASGRLKQLSRTRTRTCNLSDLMLPNHKYSQLRILLLPPLCRYNLAFFYLMSSSTVSRLVSHISLSYGGFFPFPTPKNCARVFTQCYFAVQWVIVRDVARNFDLAACFDLDFPQYLWTRVCEISFCYSEFIIRAQLCSVIFSLRRAFTYIYIFFFSKLYVILCYLWRTFTCCALKIPGL